MNGARINAEDDDTAGDFANGGHSAGAEAAEDRLLSRPIVLELSAPDDHFSPLERVLAEIDVAGVSLHESDPSSTALLTAGWQTIVVSVVSAGGLKMVRDVLVAHISSKHVKINVTRSGTKRTVTLEGHLGDSREVEQLVRDITAEQPSE